MSAYNPPKNQPPIFDTTQFYNQEQEKLNFPIAQGTEVFQDIVINGTIIIPATPIAYLNQIQTFTALNTFNGGVSIPNSLTLYNNAILDSYLSPNVPLKNNNNIFSGSTNTFNNITLSLNSTLSQSGTGIISQTGTGTNSLKNTSIADLSVSGTLTLPNQSISDLALSTNIPLKNGINTFSALNTFNGGSVFNARVDFKLGTSIFIYDSTNTKYCRFNNLNGEFFIVNNTANQPIKFWTADSVGITYDRVIIDATAMSMYVPITSNYNINMNSTSIINQSGSGQNILKSTLITDLSVNGILTLPNQSISDLALSANVPLKNSYNIFSNTNLFTGLVNFQNGGTYVSQIFANGNLFSFTNSNLGGTIEFFCNTLTIADLVSPLKLSYTGLITDNITMNANQTLTMSSGTGVINQQGGSGTNTLKSSTFSGNTTIQSGSSLILNNSLNTISTRIFQNGATLTFNNLSTPSQYLFNAYDGFGTLYPYTFGSTFSCGADITLNNYDLILLGTSNIDQTSSSGVNLMGAITMNAGTNITQSTTGIISQSGTGTNTMKAITMVAGTNITQTTTSIIDQSSSTGGTNLLKDTTLNANANFLQSGSGIISQAGTGTNTMKKISMNSNADITFQGTGKIDQSSSTGINILKNTTFSSGSVINQYNSTGAVYTSLSQTDTTTYLIENQYNTSTITLRNKNAVGTSINHSFAYNRVSLGSLLQMGANLDIILQGTGIIDQTIGTGTNILNIIKFNNSTSNKQITLYENSATDIATNYTISVEGSRIRYNVNSGATHLFSTGTGVSTYSTHASINSTGLTMAGNRNVVQSGTGILSQTGTGINLMKNITLNVDNNLLQSGIGVIQQSGTGTNALKGSTFSANNTHYNGSAIIQYDSTNVFYTQLNQSGADYIIANGGGAIFLNTNEVNLTNSYATLKGGTSVSGYNTHFPFTDGVNYITGQTIMRGGAVEITDGPLVLPNETPINLFDTEPTTNQFTISCSVGDLKFDNYTDPLITSGGGNINFQTYNLTTPIPRFHTRLNINYDGIQVKRGHLKIYNDDETYQLQLEQTGYTSQITNYAYTSSLTPYFNLRTTNSSGTQVENIKMNPSNVQITTSLQTDDIIKLQTAYTNLPSSSPNNLGYIGSGYNTTIKTTPFSFTSGTPNWIAYMILEPGVWLITGQGGFQCGGSTVFATTYLSLTTSASFVIDNDHVKVDSRSYVSNSVNTNQIIRTIQFASGYTNIYLALQCNFSSGSFSYSSTAVPYTNIYATRIG